MFTIGWNLFKKLQQNMLFSKEEFKSCHLQLLSKNERNTQTHFFLFLIRLQFSETHFNHRATLNFLSKSRSGFYGKDTIAYYNKDRVVSEKETNTLKSLGVVPSDLAEPAMQILRLYRRPVRNLGVHENNQEQ